MVKVIEAKNLSFDYGKGNILDNINFSVSESDFVCVIGQNGSGKSTLIKLILAQLMPKSGEIRLFGTKTKNYNDWTKIGYVPQNILNYVGFPATVSEVVEANLFSQIGLMRFAKKIHKEKVMDVLSLVGLSSNANSLVSSLSGGQQQRLMIARALVSMPKLLLLDEPTSGIDFAACDMIYDLLCKLRDQTGITIVMITHDTGHALQYSNRIFCIEDSSLLELDRVQLEHELSRRHMHPHKK